MKQIRYKHTASFFAGLLILAASNAAFAQYAWIDDKGNKQYSDMPPPANISEKNILKAPGKTTRLPAASATMSDENSVADKEGDSKSDATTNKEKTAMTTAEKNADFKKRQAEQAEKEKKAADEEKRQADKKKNCANIRQYQTSLEGGDRIAQTNAKGERVLMSDEQRGKEIKENRQNMAACN